MVRKTRSQAPASSPIPQLDGDDRHLCIMSEPEPGLMTIQNLILSLKLNLNLNLILCLSLSLNQILQRRT